MTTAPQIITIPEHYLMEIRDIADEEGKSAQEILDTALSSYLKRKRRERFPEVMKHFDDSMRDNRKFYELLAER